MYNYQIWIELAESAEQSDLGGLEKKVGELRKFVAERTTARPEDPVYKTNFSWLLQYSVGHNHIGIVYEQLMGVLEWIVEHLPGSHGLVYISDDEDPTMNNHFQVLVVSRGRIEKRMDPFLSPLIPVIEDEFDPREPVEDEFDPLESFEDEFDPCEPVEETHTTPRVSWTAAAKRLWNRWRGR